MRSRLLALALSTISCVACREGRVERKGAAQQLLIERTYPIRLTSFREAILRTFAGYRAPVAAPFASMKVTELKPPNYSSDWLVTTVDSNGFLGSYKQMDAGAKQNDLLLEEPTGDVYWDSEYVSSQGAPVKFRCGFIIHMEESADSVARIQVYEKVPQVWPGMYWTFGHSGPGEYRDIRFVEPTVKDRLALLDVLTVIGSKKDNMY
jgi:hypothetical protein